MQRLACVLAGILWVGVRLSASALPCVSGGSLASYEALGSTGCTIGPQTVENFTFSAMATGATAVSDSNIAVTPETGSGFYGVQIGSTGFSVTTGSVTYTIGYTWDSRPIDGMGDVLDPPSGNVDISTELCVGAAFSGTTCSGTLTSVSVSTGSPNGMVDFAPTMILGVLETISLTGPGSFDAIENDGNIVPEPGSLMLALFGVILIAYTANLRFERGSEHRRRARR